LADSELHAREEALKAWLSRIAMAWNGTNEALLAVIDLDRSGKKDYIAAILSETLPDGTKIEHAVAAAPNTASDGKYDDAVFLLRGEQGVDNGEVWLTWRDVFVGVGRTKRDAQLLGARRMLHTPTLDSRIEDVLTREPDLIDDPRYFL
jgi:hypothetical protein